MSKIIAQESATIHAPADLVYSIIADYKEGHPNITPKKYFNSLQVEKGGYGEGTEIRFAMVVMGKKTEFHHHIHEPEPGKILREVDFDSDAVTEFNVESAANDSEAEVTIKTTWTPKGINGFFQRFTAASILQKIYREELSILNDFAIQKKQALKVHLN